MIGPENATPTGVEGTVPTELLGGWPPPSTPSSGVDPHPRRAVTVRVPRATTLDIEVAVAALVHDTAFSRVTTVW